MRLPSLCRRYQVGERRTHAEQFAAHQQHIADALATLREAITAGWKDFDQIHKDPDLAPLREVPEFKVLFKSSQKKSLAIGGERLKVVQQDLQTRLG